MKSKLISIFILSCCFCITSVSAKSTQLNFCEDIHAKHEQFDIEAMQVFDKNANFRQRQECKIKLRLRGENTDLFTCETFTHSISSDSKNHTKYLNYANQNFSSDIYQRCITYALTVPSVRLDFNIFKKLLEDLLLMKLSNQQGLLDETLGSYIANDKQALKHQYVQHLLELGANPAFQTKHDVSILTEAFWAVYVGGGTCKAVRLIIDAMNPKDFSIPYVRRTFNNQLGYGATPLMAMTDLNLYCSEETLLVAEKASNIDAQDIWGNTALHYYYLDILERGGDSLNESDLSLINILLERGASSNIVNKDNITAKQLNQKLKGQKRRSCIGQRCAELELKLGLQDK